MTTNINRNKLIALMNATVGHIKYGLGKKFPAGWKPGDPLPKAVDCSGYARMLLRSLSPDFNGLPDGSVQQADWFAGNGYAQCSYGNCDAADGILRIAFIRGTLLHPIGHVWLIASGNTIESYGGHGPGRRLWNSKPLPERVTKCFVIGKMKG
jgi:hypothetical protein